MNMAGIQCDVKYFIVRSSLFCIKGAIFLKKEFDLGSKANACSSRSGRSSLEHVY